MAGLAAPCPPAVIVANRPTMRLTLAATLLAALVFAPAAIVLGGDVAPAAQPVNLAMPAAGSAPVSTATVPVAASGRSREAERVFRRNERARVPTHAVTAYVPLYRLAGRTFGVSWLLIASVHKQETAFSTSPGIYRGLNFADCCAGPMQFNVTNGPVSTWDRYKHSFRRARRPAGYPHRTARHPSVYDDFDAIMAAAALLADGGAGRGQDWNAAYDYYGHDATGVLYANQVLARAVTWRRKGFCPSCPTDPKVLARIQAEHGPVATAPAPQPSRGSDRRSRSGHSAREREAERRRRRPRNSGDGNGRKRAENKPDRGGGRRGRGRRRQADDERRSGAVAEPPPAGPAAPEPAPTG
jgi:hypothetical protein